MHWKNIGYHKPQLSLADNAEFHPVMECDQNHEEGENKILVNWILNVLNLTTVKKHLIWHIHVNVAMRIRYKRQIRNTN